MVLLLVLAMCCKISFGYQNHWTPEMAQFASYMNVLCVVDINDVEQERTDLEIGAFCGEQCRGSKFAEQFPVTGKYIFRLAVYGNSGDNITFRLYDHELQTELELESQNTLVWENDGYGSLGNPYVLYFTGGTPTSFTFLGSATDHNWSTASNWLENMVPQSGSEVIIDGLCTLDQDATVSTITINEDQSLTILSGRKLTTTDVVSEDASNLIINDGGQLSTQTENTVYATVKKDIAAYTGARDNYYFVAPAAFTASKYRIKTNTTNMLSGEYDLYWFDQISPMEEWQNYEASPFSYLYMKKGYLYANSAITTLSFAGKLITTDAEEVGLDYDDEESVFPGFTLIGNPFPCNATVSGEDLVENAYYVMNEAGGRKNVIVAMNPVVAPCTGLFAVAANEDAVVTFTPSVSNATVRGSQSCIRMESFDSLNQLEDRLYVKTGEGNGLQKFSLDSHATRLYVNSNGKDYAVVPFIGSSEMTVNFTTETYGRHTISVSPENFSCDYLHLIDNLTGADIDLLAASNSYTFEAKPSDYAARFKLVFNATGVEENHASASTSNFAFMSNGNLVIDHIEGEATLQIIDMTGRSISSEKVNGNYNKHLNLNAGVYVLNLNGMTQKIVVK